MEFYDYLKIILFIALILLVAQPLGSYIKKALCNEKTYLDKLLVPAENILYSICRIKPEEEQNWKEYTVSLLLFNFMGFVFLFLLQALQRYLPLNPQHLENIPFWLNINTTASFVTNTNWQAYSGETTVSYLVQMAGLTVQNFVSGATGIATAVALFRGFTRKNQETIGNFWRDLTRSTLWILLPLSVIIAIIYIAQGVPQNLSNYITAHTLDGAQQIIPQGPVAGQEAIKSLGTNGGGFFGANSMHPYENPTPLTNLLQCLSIFLIGVSLTYTFGFMTGNGKQGRTILLSMMILFATLIAAMYLAESQSNPALRKMYNTTSMFHPDNMEGKETRFGIADSVLYTSVTTSASDGGVNSDISSSNPLTGGIAMLNMALGEIIIGGVGTGMYNMIMFIILTVFIAGLMVGRTPEFLGKKIGTEEVKWVMIATLISPFCILFFTSMSCLIPSILKETASYGPHGFSRILYAFISAANNNGSALSGLNFNTDYFNITTAISMVLGRFVSIVAVLAVAGSLARKKTVPETSGSFPTTGLLFIVMLIICIFVVGALNFFPALALGPITEHLLLFQ